MKMPRRQPPNLVEFIELPPGLVLRRRCACTGAADAFVYAVTPAGTAQRCGRTPRRCLLGPGEPGNRRSAGRMIVGYWRRIPQGGPRRGNASRFLDEGQRKKPVCPETAPRLGGESTKPPPGHAGIIPRRASGHIALDGRSRGVSRVGGPQPRGSAVPAGTDGA